MTFHPGIGELVLAGGGAAKSSLQPELYFDDVWSWNGKRWRLVASTGFAQNCARLVHDSKRDRLLLHGGCWSDTGTAEGKLEVLGQLRELRDGRWHVIDEGAPRKMCDHAAFCHAPTNEIVLFGRGTDGTGGSWYFDGTAWQHEPAAPGNLVGFGAAYDVARNVLVVFGGFTEESGPNHSTWELSGRKWTEVAKAGPEPRDASVLAYVSNAKAVVLYGGVGERGELTDTWRWRGGQWTRLPATGPGPFDMPTMASDPVRKVTVLIGTPRQGGAMQVWEMAADENWVRVQ